MNVIDRPLAELKPYEKNAKKHNQTQIENVAESIRQFGFVQPVVVDRDGVIIIGHCRVLAAQKLGMKTVPCLTADDLTPQQVRELRLLDNKLNESPWDAGLLQVELAGLDLSNFTLDWQLPEPDVDLEEDDVPDLDTVNEPTAQPGWIYQLGQHFVMCGNATVETDVNRLMAGRKADLLLTDPPYNVSYVGTAGSIMNDTQTDEHFRAFLKDAFAAARAVMVPGGGFYIFHADSEGYNFRGACRDVGFRVRQCLIWVKDSLVLGRQDYHWQHEPVLEGEADIDQGETHEPVLYGWKDGAGHKWNSDRKQTTVLHFPRPKKSEEHPTMKPVKLCGYLVKNSTVLGALVFDPFGGSGSTLIACEQLGRECRVMELDPRYVDLIVRRWEAFTGSAAVRVV